MHLKTLMRSFFLSTRKLARTFGHHLFKRLSFAIIPTAFVVGIIITLLAALTVVSVKSLGVGVSNAKLICYWTLLKYFQGIERFNK